MATNLSDIQRELDASQIVLLSIILNQMLEKKYTGKQLNEELVEKRGYKLQAVRLALKKLNPLPANLNDLDKELAGNQAEINKLQFAKQFSAYPDDEVEVNDERAKVNTTVPLAKPIPQVLANTSPDLQATPAPNTVTLIDNKSVQSQPLLAPIANRSLFSLSTLTLGWFGTTEKPATLEPKKSPVGSRLRADSETNTSILGSLNNAEPEAITFQFSGMTLNEEYLRSSSAGTSNDASKLSSGPATPIFVDVDKNGAIGFSDWPGKRRNSLH